jgi:GR25 family glycosyltransferase involved in LPS biosynthesis
MDRIEHVVYINLEHRTDRRKEIEAELACFGDRVERFNAIRHVTGGIGCSMSHLQVLKRAKEAGWKNVLVVEDDFVWNRTEEGMTCFERIIQKPFDVILVSGADIICSSDNRLVSGQAATCYLVASHYYDTLIQNFIEGVLGFMKTGHYPTYALDQYWKRLQPSDHWYIVTPILGIQRPSYSDIEHKFTDYRSFFMRPPKAAPSQ